MPTKAQQPVPQGMNTLTPHFWFNGDCQDAIAFYQRAFNAQLSFPAAMSPDNATVMHAMLKIGDSNLMLADAMPGNWEAGPDGSTSVGLWAYVEDSDAAFRQAQEAGCIVLEPLWDAFWGDRTCKLKDPFGHTWILSTRKWEYTPEEMKASQEAWMSSMKQPS
jgi:PhnB protein